MNAALPMGGNRITNVADPSGAQDAATKNYCTATFLTIATATATYLPLAGGTLTGAVTQSAANPSFTQNKSVSGNVVQIYGQTGGLNRWLLRLGNNGAESGANAGADCDLFAWNDAGTIPTQVWTISRATQVMALNQRPTFAGNTAIDTGNLPAVLQGYLSGLTLSRASATTFTVAVGTAKNEDAGTGFMMTLASAFTKSLSAWVVGTGNGGLDTGAVAASTWYHVHLIRKDSDASIDVLYSLSVAAPTMPAGYTARRRMGSILTNGSSQIVAFSQVGNEFLWDAAVIDVDAANPGTSAVTRTLTAPTGVKTIVILDIGVYNGTTTGAGANISSLDVSDQATQSGSTAALTGISGVSSGTNAGTATWAFAEARIRTNTSAQVRSRLSVSGALDHIGIITRGWVDARGTL